MPDEYVTKSYLKTELLAFGQQLKSEIVDEISTVLAGAMTAIGISFGGLENRFDKLSKVVTEIKASQNRVEAKLDYTVARVDEHDIQIKHLKRKIALG